MEKVYCIHTTVHLQVSKMDYIDWDLDLVLKVRHKRSTITLVTTNENENILSLCIINSSKDLKHPASRFVATKPWENCSWQASHQKTFIFKDLISLFITNDLSNSISVIVVAISPWSFPFSIRWSFFSKDDYAHN